jgi:hypothetical protein
MFAKFSINAAITIGKYSNFNRSTPTTNKKLQHRGLTYKPPQNILESTVDISAMSSRDSKIHSLDPSSFTYDHHRRPTNNLPDTFFTVQKSNANKMMHMTKVKIKLLVNQEPKTYRKSAKNLNNRWKKIVTGCCK